MVIMMVMIHVMMNKLWLLQWCGGDDDVDNDDDMVMIMVVMVVLLLITRWSLWHQLYL